MVNKLKTVITLYLDSSTKRTLSKESLNRGLSRSKLVEIAVKNFFKVRWGKVMNPKLVVKDEIQKELKRLQATDSEFEEVLKRLGYSWDFVPTATHGLTTWKSASRDTMSLTGSRDIDWVSWFNDGRIW